MKPLFAALVSSIAVLGAFVLVNAQANNAAWGTVKGRIVYDGATAPAPQQINVDKDQQHCLAKGKLFREDLVVNKKNMGVRWVFVWLAPQKGDPPLKVHPALQQMRNITFHAIDNDALLAYSKFDPITGDCVLVVVTLDAFGPEQATLWLDMAALGMEPYERFWVRDEITGEEYQWGAANYVRLDPGRAVAHVINMPLVPSEARIPLLCRR